MYFELKKKDFFRVVMHIFFIYEYIVVCDDGHHKRLVRFTIIICTLNHVFKIAPVYYRRPAFSISDLWPAADAPSKVILIIHFSDKFCCAGRFWLTEHFGIKNQDL